MMRPLEIAESGDLEPLEDVERRHVLRVLEAVGNNKTVAARILRIGRKTLLRKLTRWQGESVSARKPLETESR